MPGEGISPELTRFIVSTINSVEHLEVLLFMMSNRTRGWSTQELSQRVRLNEESVAAVVAELHKAQLLRLEADASSQYCYDPATTALADEVAAQLDKAYREQRGSVIELIYTRPMDNIRILADAFRIRGGED